MKSVYVILLMGVAAVAGGLLVRYNEHPVRIAQSHPVPPAVVAPPVPPAGHMPPDPEPAPAIPEKPSALSLPVHVGKPAVAAEPPGKSEPAPAPRPTIVARMRIPADPPAVFPLGHTVDPVVTTPAAARQAASIAPVPAAPAPAVPAPEPAPAPAAALVQPEPPPNRVTLRPGLLISVRINQGLSSDRNAQGDVWNGTLDRPLTVDGFVIAERGARVRGEVIAARNAARGQGAGELTIELKEVSLSDGQNVQIVTAPWRKQGPSSTGEDMAKIGGGAALGAIIGAAAGGGRGAGIGAGIGGAAGAGDVMMTHGRPALIRPETDITFRVEQLVEVTERRP